MQTEGSKHTPTTARESADRSSKRSRSHGSLLPYVRAINETPHVGRPAPGSGEGGPNKPNAATHEPPAVREGFGVLLQLARALTSG